MPWSLDTCSTQRSPVHRVQMHGASIRDIQLYPPHNSSSVCLTTTGYLRRSGRIINGMRSGRTTLQDSALQPRHPPPRNDPPKNRLRTGAGRFRSCLYNWGMASSAACECGAEEQIVDHVVLQCVVYRTPHGLYGLKVLDNETIKWLLNTLPRNLVQPSSGYENYLREEKEAMSNWNC